MLKKSILLLSIFLLIILCNGMTAFGKETPKEYTDDQYVHFYLGTDTAFVDKSKTDTTNCIARIPFKVLSGYSSNDSIVLIEARFKYDTMKLTYSGYENVGWSDSVKIEKVGDSGSYFIYRVRLTCDTVFASNSQYTLVNLLFTPKYISSFNLNAREIVFVGTSNSFFSGIRNGGSFTNSVADAKLHKDSVCIYPPVGEFSLLCNNSVDHSIGDTVSIYVKGITNVRTGFFAHEITFDTSKLEFITGIDLVDTSYLGPDTIYKENNSVWVTIYSKDVTDIPFPEMSSSDTLYNLKFRIKKGIIKDSIPLLFNEAGCGLGTSGYNVSDQNATYNDGFIILKNGATYCKFSLGSDSLYVNGSKTIQDSCIAQIPFRVYSTNSPDGNYTLTSLHTSIHYTNDFKYLGYDTASWSGNVAITVDSISNYKKVVISLNGGTENIPINQETEPFIYIKFKTIGTSSGIYNLSFIESSGDTIYPNNISFHDSEKSYNEYQILDSNLISGSIKIRQPHATFTLVPPPTVTNALGQEVWVYGTATTDTRTGIIEHGISYSSSYLEFISGEVLSDSSYLGPDTIYDEGDSLVNITIYSTDPVDTLFPEINTLDTLYRLKFKIIYDAVSGSIPLTFKLSQCLWGNPYDASSQEVIYDSCNIAISESATIKGVLTGSYSSVGRKYDAAPIIQVKLKNSFVAGIGRDSSNSSTGIKIVMDKGSKYLTLHSNPIVARADNLSYNSESDSIGTPTKYLAVITQTQNLDTPSYNYRQKHDSLDSLFNVRFNWDHDSADVNTWTWSQQWIRPTFSTDNSSHQSSISDTVPSATFPVVNNYGLTYDSIEAIKVRMAQFYTSTTYIDTCAHYATRKLALRHNFTVNGFRVRITVPALTSISNVVALNGITKVAVNSTTYDFLSSTTFPDTSELLDIATFRISKQCGNTVWDSVVVSDSLYVKHTWNNEGDIITTTQYLVAPSTPGAYLSCGECGGQEGEYKQTASGGQVPKVFSLDQNFPNPFNPTTTISLNLPKASDWKITIFNVLGQQVKEFTGHSEAGVVKVNWDATRFASGVYMYRAEAGSFTATKKMILMK